MMLSLFTKSRKWNVGKIVTFGKYPQNNQGISIPIEWIVLKIENNKALLISKHCLLTTPFCNIKKVTDDDSFLTWEFSVARKVLNNDFFNNAFDQKEQSKIIPRTIIHSNHFNGTTDKVFLLTENEVVSFFPTKKSRYATPTQIAVNNGARIDMAPKGNACWWIMPHVEEYSYEHRFIYPKAVFQNGEIQHHSRNVYHSDFTLRPSILVELESN